jgi:hypothetical protein
MAIELEPVVLWVFQEPNCSYPDRRDELMRAFAGAAKGLLARYAKPERSGMTAEQLTYMALLKMQLRLLGQYLPAISATAAKSAGALWPFWEQTGMKVLYDRDRVHHVSPLPDGNGAVYPLKVADGREFKLTFYRNDSEDQRRTMIYGLLKAEALSEKKALVRELPLDADLQVSSAEPWDPVSGSDEIHKWRSITDPQDWKDAAVEKGSAGAVRKRRERARRRLRAAHQILTLSHTSESARIYLGLLQRCEVRERKDKLQEYVRRYYVETEPEEE